MWDLKFDFSVSSHISKTVADFFFSFLLQVLFLVQVTHNGLFQLCKTLSEFWNQYVKGFLYVSCFLGQIISWMVMSWRII